MCDVNKNILSGISLQESNAISREKSAELDGVDVTPVCPGSVTPVVNEVV